MLNWYNTDLVRIALLYSGGRNDDPRSATWEFKIGDITTTHAALAAVLLLYSKMCEDQNSIRNNARRASGQSINPDHWLWMLGSTIQDLRSARNSARIAGHSVTPYHLLLDELHHEYVRITTQHDSREMKLRRIRDAIDAAVVQTPNLNMTFLERLHSLKNVTDEDITAQSFPAGRDIEAARSAVKCLIALYRKARDERNFTPAPTLIETAYIKACRSQRGLLDGKTWPSRMYAYVSISSSGAPVEEEAEEKDEDLKIIDPVPYEDSDACYSLQIPIGHQPRSWRLSEHIGKFCRSVAPQIMMFSAITIMMYGYR